MSVQLTYTCPSCQSVERASLDSSSSAIQCGKCSLRLELRPGAIVSNVPETCSVCGCRDLWRQKDFSPQLGLAIVALGAVASTVAFAWYRPLLALGILGAFALLDVVLFLVMPDVMVCYRCHARYRSFRSNSPYNAFNLETAERYRHEAARAASARSS